MSSLFFWPVKAKSIQLAKRELKNKDSRRLRMSLSSFRILFLLQAMAGVGEKEKNDRPYEECRG